MTGANKVCSLATTTASNSPALAEALIEGIAASGRDVVNIGPIPTDELVTVSGNKPLLLGPLIMII